MLSLGNMPKSCLWLCIARQHHAGSPAISAKLGRECIKFLKMMWLKFCLIATYFWHFSHAYSAHIEIQVYSLTTDVESPHVCSYFSEIHLYILFCFCARIFRRILTMFAFCHALRYVIFSSRVCIFRSLYFMHQK